MCESAHCVCVLCVDAHRDQKRALDHLEMELQVVVSCPRWAQGIKLGCHGRLASNPN